MRILQCISTIRRSHGGTSVFTAELAQTLAGERLADVALLTGRHGDDLPVPSDVQRLELASGGARDWLLPGGSSAGRETSRWLQAGRGIVHVHGLWLSSLRAAARAALTAQVPLVYSPHGMLEPWSLAQGALKKRLALALYQRRILERSAVLHATAQMEADNFRRLGLRNPIAVLPVGVPLPVVTARGESAQRTAVFLSRIHPKKGVLELLRAWKAVAPAGWRLRLAGPDEGGHLAEVLAERSRLGLDSVVDYIGSVAGEKKAELFRGADLFVLPTYSENFGIVVPEALSYGVPVVTTRGAPWEELGQVGCGWWIDTGQEALNACLREVLGLPAETLRAAGARGRRLVEERYQWSSVARRFRDVYGWALEGGAPPECVQLDARSKAGT